MQYESLHGNLPELSESLRNEFLRHESSYATDIAGRSTEVGLSTGESAHIRSTLVITAEERNN